VAMAPRDRLRFELGDTDTRLPLFSDAELDELLTENDGEILLAAAAACEIMATRTAGDFDFDSLDQKSFKRSKVSAAWSARAEALRERHAAATRGGGLNVVAVERADSYSDEAEGLDATGHVRAGWWNPDEGPV